MKIAIAGFGFVGQALYGSLNKDGIASCVIHDPPQNMDNFSELLKCNLIFCCLPTPENAGKQDFSYYSKFFDKLIDEDFKGTLVIKSTVLHRNIKPYIKELNITMNPEFLTENNSYEDFRSQKVIVLGGRRDLCQKVAACYLKFFELKVYKFEFCSLKDAIDIKYFHNIYHAYKALFWNYVYEQCGNHRKIAKMYHSIVERRNELSQVAADGKLGYGGSCFPKDVKAMQEDRPHELTKFMIEYNRKLRKEDI